MIEDEAIKEIETSVELAKMCIQNFERKREIEAYTMAIEALKKQEKIKEAFKIWKFETGGYYCADDETISLIRTLKEILRSDDE